jgi:two-component system chemotaxis sensor kinase CheA
MLREILKVVILPKEISAFESQYLSRVNKVTLQFFLLHVPAFVLVAWFNDTRPLLALLLTSVVAAGPVLAYRSLANPRTVGLVFGFTAMLMGGLLVHFGQGPVQIEMHFYFFALIAMLALYGNPLAIVVAAVTVAAHHLLLWLILPASVFNYAAPWWVVGVHAAFVVLESVATVYIARSFFDNVIGLERVVAERTHELDQRNQAMRLVLDNVDQGLLTIDAAGRILPEYSQAIARWFGTPQAAQPFAEFLTGLDGDFGARFSWAFEQCTAGALPLALCLDQSPAALTFRRRHYRFEYRPLLDPAEALTGMLVVIADVTSDVERQRLELEQKEALEILDRVIADRAGFLEFFDEAEELLGALRTARVEDRALVQRALHTLKGNCMIFGVQTVADRCHQLESALAQGAGMLQPSQLALLDEAWSRLEQRLGVLLGDREEQRIELEQSQFEALLRAALDGRDHGEIAQLVAGIKLEPTAARLSRVAAQAKRIARRLNKQDIDVQIDDSMLRLDPKGWASFWSAFIHVVRNAVDHGLEASDVRHRAGKAGTGRLQLRTHIDGDDFAIELSDDGAGIPWERVRERARERGIPHQSQEDLIDALFAEGLSTAEEVTEFSGRGMGLSVVKAACLERGGKIEVRSDAGKGTMFVFRFPQSTIAVKPEALLQLTEAAPPPHIAALSLPGGAALPGTARCSV